MCGIAGAFSFAMNGEPVNRQVIARLNERQRRRGPDGGALWASPDERVVLGHRRLAIIDTGSTGAQPMTDATGRWMITFNGEIYNYRELRQQLEMAGRTFFTNSDTEVLINLVAEWSEAGLNKLRGMYAFALWDSLRRELWLVRDPYGIKPLYVAEHAGTLWFASQARALATCTPVDTRRDPAALTGFHLWGHVPEPFSWWAGIRMFPAGHVQRIRTDGVVSAPREFYRIANKFVERPAKPLLPGELRQLLLDSVRHHLVSDVPIGVFLSAGIDSNAIADLASELVSPLHTVTLAFHEYVGAPDDEAPGAEAAARALGSDHFTIRIGRDEFEGLLDEFMRSMDQPTIDGLNTYLVSRAAASQGFKVALSGLGGDELFGGYPAFRQIPRLLKWGRYFAPHSLGRVLQRAMRSVALPGVPPKAAGLISHSGDLASAYLLRRALHLEDELPLLVDKDVLQQGLEQLSTHAAVSRTVNPLAAASDYAKVAVLESCWYMRNQLLRDTDWASMAHGLEIRLPFVDLKVLERLGPAIVSATPPGKRDLAACAVRLPEELRHRAKTGFTTPVREWTQSPRQNAARGLRGWAARMVEEFDTLWNVPLRDQTVSPCGPLLRSSPAH
jgi:asparagine synthase (glutamine-hydrolysing)